MTGGRRDTVNLWRRRLVVLWLRNRRWFPALEWAAPILLLIVGVSTWIWLTEREASDGLLSPPVAALVLLANLLPAIAILVLVGRRIAKRWAAGTAIGGSGRLHVRLVATFSMVASIPVVLMVIIASLLFQYGVDTWYSQRARQMFENTTALALQIYAEKQQRVTLETEAMAGDIGQLLAGTQIESRAFADQFAFQVYQRELSEGAILAITPDRGVQTLAVVNPYERPTENWVPADVAKQMTAQAQTVFRDAGGRMEAITPLPNSRSLFLYASRVADDATLARAKRAEQVLKDYNALAGRAGKLQLRLNVALYLVSLLIIAGAVWAALAVADRLVRPVAELVGAARQVAEGDLTARVSETRSRDEVGLLSRAFNRMTERLDSQNRRLTSANDLLDRRRALIEAVLTGVSAGVVAVDGARKVRIINDSAGAFLKVDRDAAVGMALADLAPELDRLVEDGTNDAIVAGIAGGEARTFAVKRVADEGGHVLTFDDITQQLSDQRLAAWSDVARRIAHEIKNPLTPIQLAAERLRKRFGTQIETDAPMFVRLTDTIIRQVGDLRRMVDEFSSFARLPKPIFAQESLVDVVREAVFLHEVAHPDIDFTLTTPDPPPQMICDRRQLAQAISNIVKNGVEAIAALPQREGRRGAIDVTMSITECSTIAIAIADSGTGLPIERDRIIEPYMTTRASGTGLGLAIVKKIVEEHAGTIGFSDRDGGGTIVTLTLDPAMVAAYAAQRGTPKSTAEALPAALTARSN